MVCTVVRVIGCQAYKDGINFWLDNYGMARPVEFVQMNYWPPRWEMADTLATVELPSYVAAIEQVILCDYVTFM